MKRKRSRGGGEWRKEGKERREKERNERRMEEGRDRRKEKRKHYLSCHNKIWHRLDNSQKKKALSLQDQRTSSLAPSKGPCPCS